MLYDVLAPAAQDPTLLEPVPAAGTYLMAEVRYAATHEAALHLDDVLARRTRISIETTHRGVDSARPVAQLLASALGWDDDTREREIESYIARVEAERLSQEETDDVNADARRLLAPDTRQTVV
jgi:glycerol-3-phosphate dehydrogenase